MLHSLCSLLSSVPRPLHIPRSSCKQNVFKITNYKKKMSVFLPAFKLEHDNISHIKAVISQMFVCHSCLNWEASGFNVVVWFVNNIAIWAHSMHHTYIWCKSTFYPHGYVIPRVAVIHVSVSVSGRDWENVTLHLLIWASVCAFNWALQVASVLPIINNNLNVDMSAFLVNLHIWFLIVIFFFYKKCFLFCTVTPDETHVWSSNL